MAKRYRRSLKLGVPLNIAELESIRRAAGTGSVAAWARAVLVEAASGTEDPTRIRDYPTKKRGN